jgi:hypothetical protein
MLSIELAILSLLLAVVGYVYVYVLTDMGNILGWWYDLLTNHIKNQYLLKPLLTCEYCVVGQLAFWFYIYWCWYSYNIVQHIFFICLSIFYVLIFNKCKLSE